MTLSMTLSSTLSLLEEEFTSKSPTDLKFLQVHNFRFYQIWHRHNNNNIGMNYSNRCVSILSVQCLGFEIWVKKWSEGNHCEMKILKNLKIDLILYIVFHCLLTNWFFILQLMVSVEKSWTLFYVLAIRLFISRRHSSAFGSFVNTRATRTLEAE